MRTVLGEIKINFPDARLTTLNSVAEGEWVVVRCTYSGTHRGTSRFPVDGGMLVGVQPTGRTFEVQHIHMYRVLDGKIAEHFANRDDIGMMRQVGLLPPPRRCRSVGWLISAIRRVGALATSLGSKPHIAAKSETTGMREHFSSCLRFAAARSFNMNSIMSGTAKMRSSHSISALV